MTTGMLLGKFLPPHAGHVYAAECARRRVDALTIVVGTLAREPIPGATRHAWVTELCPGARVVHLAEELPQEPAEHPDFWRLWRESLLRVLGEAPDVVFTSDPYGERLAAELGARWYPIDPAREALPVSGSAIRADPMATWDYLPAPVRAHYVRRVCVFGPESTGKSTLARDLARAFDTVAVPEYARTWIEARRGELHERDLPVIARAQLASEDALARRANRVLVCDTDALTTTLWADTLYGRCPAELTRLATGRRYDLTLLCDVDVAWVDDLARYRPDDRQGFLDRCRVALSAAGRAWVDVRGTWSERLDLAHAAVRALLDTPEAEVSSRRRLPR